MLELDLNTAHWDFLIAYESELPDNEPVGFNIDTAFAAAERNVSDIEFTVFI
jgi:hypothetical protein